MVDTVAQRKSLQDPGFQDPARILEAQILEAQILEARILEARVLEGTVRGEPDRRRAPQRCHTSDRRAVNSRDIRYSCRRREDLRISANFVEPEWRADAIGGPQSR